MNIPTSAKYALTFALGAVVGGVSTFLALRGYYEKRCKDTIDEVQEFYETLKPVVMPKLSDEEVNKLKDGLGVISPSMGGVSTSEEISRSHGYKIEDDKPDLKTMSKNSPLIDKIIDEDEVEADTEEDEDDEPSEEEIEDPFIDRKNPADGPYVISEDEFANGSAPQEKIEITYYEEDDTLADEDDSILQIPDVIGFDALDHFDEDGFVFVRNEKLGIDYSVRKNEGSYCEIVLGIDLDSDEARGVQSYKKHRFDEEDE